jgi:hypothetical protein
MRKGSRPIRVDGTAYRWRLRGRPTYAPALAIEQAGRPGSVLIVTTPDAAAFVVTPSVVAAMIRRARHQGWRPDRPGPPFRLSLDAI